MALTLIYYWHIKHPPSSDPKGADTGVSSATESGPLDDSNDQSSEDTVSEKAEQESSTTAGPVNAKDNTEKIEKIYPDNAKEFQGHHYLVVNESMTWEQARKKCVEMKGHLVTITSPEEQDFIRRLSEENWEKYHYWLGAAD